MRVWASLATAAILALHGRPAWAEDTQGAVDAARVVYVACDEGWRTGNVQAILDTYAPDFEWTNSVGLRFTDKTLLRTFIEHLFNNADYNAGHPGPLKIISIRKLGDDALVISSAESTFGQKDSKTGKVVPEQRSNELTVLQRIGGRWLIVSDLTSDEAHGYYSERGGEANRMRAICWLKKAKATGAAGCGGPSRDLCSDLLTRLEEHADIRGRRAH